MLAPGARMLIAPRGVAEPMTSLARTSMVMATGLFWTTSAASSPAKGAPAGYAGLAIASAVSAVAWPPRFEATRTKAGGTAPAAASNVTSARSVADGVRRAAG